MAFSNGPKSIVQDGLVFAVDAGNSISFTSGSTDAYDLMNSSITGSLINGMIYSSDGGGSWECDGTNDYAVFPLMDNIYKSGFSEATVEVWAKYASVGTVGYRAMWSYGAKAQGWACYGRNSSKIENGFLSSTGVEYSQELNAWDDGWNLITSTWNGDGTGVDIYKNGVIGTGLGGAGNGTAENTDKNLVLGGGTDYTNGDWNGWVTSLRIYNRALTATEILQNYNATKNRFQ